MLDLGRQSLRIGLAARSVALLETRGRWRPKAGPCRLADVAAPVAEQGVPATAGLAPARFEGLLATLDGLLSQVRPAPGTGVRVVLADRWLRLWRVTPPRRTLRRIDCEAAAAARYETLFGEPLDERQVLSADWRARQPFLAAALMQTRQAALVGLLHDHGLRVDAITPHCVACWNHFAHRLPRDAALATLSEGALTLALRQGTHLADLRGLAVSAGALADPGWLRAAVQREALRLGLPAPVAVGLAGPQPAAWSDAAPPASLPSGDGPWQCLPLIHNTPARPAAEQLAHLAPGTLT